jgi:hypothetical protein
VPHYLSVVHHHLCYLSLHYPLDVFFGAFGGRLCMYKINHIRHMIDGAALAWLSFRGGAALSVLRCAAFRRRQARVWVSRAINSVVHHHLCYLSLHYPLDVFFGAFGGRLCMYKI